MRGKLSLHWHSGQSAIKTANGPHQLRVQDCRCILLLVLTSVGVVQPQANRCKLHDA